MHKRILTTDEVVATERLAMQHGSQPRILAKPCIELCLSHRRLEQKVKELEIKIAERSTQARAQADGLDHWANVLEAQDPESSAKGIIMLRAAAKTLRGLNHVFS